MEKSMELQKIIYGIMLSDLFSYLSPNTCLLPLPFSGYKFLGRDCNCLVLINLLSTPPPFWDKQSRALLK